MIELNGKKILITFLMHLGDVVLTTPFIHALRKAAPDSHITYLVDEKLIDIIDLKMPLPKVEINLIYVESYLTNIANMFIKNYINKGDL